MGRWLFWFTMMTAVASAEDVEVRGRVVDASQGPLPMALVRLIPAGAGFARFRSLTDLKGEFSIRDVPAGTYDLRIGRQAFREQAISALELHSGELKHLGTIRLELSGCDAPDVICDSVSAGAPEPDRVVSKGYITMSPGSGVDLDSGKVFPSDRMKTAKLEQEADLMISFDAGSWRMIPINGALLSPPDCRKFTEVPIRLDGLGPGAEFCVQTDRRRYSHVFLIEEVRLETSSVRLWQMTRR